MSAQTPVPGLLRGFFEDYLAAQRDVSQNIIYAYRVLRTKNCLVYVVSVCIPAARRIAVMRREMLRWSSPVTASPRLTGLPSARLAASRKIRCSPPSLN
jgi:hypothetical protein